MVSPDSILRPTLPAGPAVAEPRHDEIWTELPIAPGQKLCDLPGFHALTREGWLLASAYLSGAGTRHRMVRLYLTRPNVADN